MVAPGRPCPDGGWTPEVGACQPKTLRSHRIPAPPRPNRRSSGPELAWARAVRPERVAPLGAGELAGAAPRGLATIGTAMRSPRRGASSDLRRPRPGVLGGDGVTAHAQRVLS